MENIAEKLGCAGEPKGFSFELPPARFDGLGRQQRLQGSFQLSVTQKRSCRCPQGALSRAEGSGHAAGSHWCASSVLGAPSPVFPQDQGQTPGSSRDLSASQKPLLKAPWPLRHGARPRISPCELPSCPPSPEAPGAAFLFPLHLLSQLLRGGLGAAPRGSAAPCPAPTGLGGASPGLKAAPEPPRTTAKPR